ncbi:MAG: beta-ketoacyl-ACP synthase III [Alphaproteobacteria bacterium]|nr:beta-ketoacyl-ACP synthase III [Alphaproteobacteria bacterium]
MSVLRSQVAGVGAYLPARVVSNAELAKKLETSDEWIRERTGIRERRIAADGECTSDLAIAASQEALRAAGMNAGAIDLIVLATATPDETFPATATTVQARLGITRGAAFDIQAVCSGFVYAVATADNFIKAGQAKNVLVIGAETFSRIIDWNDRTTAVLFGDGAGAMILTAAQGQGDTKDRGVLSTHLFSDGRHHDLLYVDGGPSKTMTTGFLRMEGREVFRHAVANMADAIDLALKTNGIQASDVDWFVPHQANQRILDATARKVGVHPSRVVSTVAQHANTSAASVPLALVAAVNDGRIKRENLVLLEAMGGGFTWGSALIRW